MTPCCNMRDDDPVLCRECCGSSPSCFDRCCLCALVAGRSRSKPLAFELCVACKGIVSPKKPFCEHHMPHPAFKVRFFFSWFVALLTHMRIVSTNRVSWARWRVDNSAPL